MQSLPWERYELIKTNINIYCITKRNFKFVRLKATIFESWGCIYFVNSLKIDLNQFIISESGV